MDRKEGWAFRSRDYDLEEVVGAEREMKYGAELQKWRTALSGSMKHLRTRMPKTPKSTKLRKPLAGGSLLAGDGDASN